MKLARQAVRLANNFQEMPRNEADLETSAVLIALARVYEAAHDMIKAKTHEQSQKSYEEIRKLINESNNT